MTSSGTAKLVVAVIGTRPDAIKMAPVIRALREDGEIAVHVCVSGQHRELIVPALAAFSLVADSELDVDNEKPNLAALAAGVLTGIDALLQRLRPARVLVQGDTTTCMAAAVAAFYRRVPVAHVEAGLRTGNLNAPWPEEFNRKLTTLSADLHFAPTGLARQNLLEDGVSPESIHVTGNTVVDAVMMAAQRIDNDPLIARAIAAELPAIDPTRRLILATLHRRESIGMPLANICRAIKTIALREPVEVVLPVHPNPGVRSEVLAQLSDVPNIHLVPPLSYFALVSLLRDAFLVLTDSGGLQEEAPAFGKPIIIVREITERPEVVTSGHGLIGGTDYAPLVGTIEETLHDTTLQQRLATIPNPFGDGHASQRIVVVLKRVV